MFSFVALVVFAGALLLTPLVFIGLAWRERWQTRRKGEAGEDTGGKAR